MSENKEVTTQESGQSISYPVDIKSFPQCEIHISVNFDAENAMRFSANGHEFIGIATDDKGNTGLSGRPLSVAQQLDLLNKFFGAMLANAYGPPAGPGIVNATDEKKILRMHEF